MALETVKITVGPDYYVQIGDNVTALTATETLVGGMRAYIVATGGTAPDVDEINWTYFDGKLTFTGSAADIYVLSPKGETEIGVVRE